MSLEKVSQHIDIPGDKLVPDAEFLTLLSIARVQLGS